MIDAERLEQIAAQLAGRVRDDHPEANARWLAAVTTEQDRYALLFVLAAMVPDDVPVSTLTNWTRSRGGPGGALRPHGTSAAVGRHNYYKEPLCPLCRAHERERVSRRRQS